MKRQLLYCHLCPAACRVCDPRCRAVDQSRTSSDRFRVAGDQRAPGWRKDPRRLGTAYFKAGRFGVALDEARVAQAFDPEYAPVYHLFGQIYMYLDDKVAARQNFEKASALAPAIRRSTIRMAGSCVPRAKSGPVWSASPRLCATPTTALRRGPSRMQALLPAPERTRPRSDSSSSRCRQTHQYAGALPVGIACLQARGLRYRQRPSADSPAASGSNG